MDDPKPQPVRRVPEYNICAGCVYYNRPTRCANPIGSCSVKNKTIYIRLGEKAYEEYVTARTKWRLSCDK